MKTDELREKYLAFFESKGHTPLAQRRAGAHAGTPRVLFTPAGMNQFKDHFWARCKLEFTRATTCQKCLRTGDIDNVGRTAYHHTFFEMLGNFSFGDYFKREAINWAWEFLTDKKWLGHRPGAADRHGLQRRRRGGRHLGQRHQARRRTASSGWARTTTSGRPAPRARAPTASAARAARSTSIPTRARAVEIWNLVFTQFNRVGDPPNNLRPLPSKNIDTGMGLERTAAMLQGVRHELPHRHPAADRRGRGRSVRREVRARQRQRPPAAAHHRPRARLHVRRPRERLPRRRTRRSTSSSGCCAGPCSTAIRWACASRSCTSSCRRWPR